MSIFAHDTLILPKKIDLKMAQAYCISVSATALLGCGAKLIFSFSLNPAPLDNLDDLVGDLREFLGGPADLFVTTS